MSRVSRAFDALYSSPRRTQKRRRCDGHLADAHWIEVGEQVIWSALPPNSDIGNPTWWHHALCVDCAPESTLDALGEVTT